MLLDKNIIGGSSSGRSAGFLTPDSELELHQLVRRYGVKAAGEIWEAPLRGIERIVAAIKKYDIQCGLLKQDSLFLGLGKVARRPWIPSWNAGRRSASPTSAPTTSNN